MSHLTEIELAAAVAFNHEQHHAKELWMRVQTRVGAAADGIPGRETAARVAALQAELGIAVDGKIGRETLAALRVALPSLGRIHRFPGDAACFYLGKLAVDADGAPSAYHPADIGLDALANAGRPGNWWALATDETGEPCVQTACDPCPGYYVSTTALIDATYPPHDPRRYVDAAQIPYIVLPRNLGQLIDPAHPHKGDLAAVCLLARPSDIVFAIYADVGPAWRPGHEPGEGSIALARALGHEPIVNGRVRRSIGSGVFYVIFPGSGERRPLPAAEIQARGQAAFAAWGGHDTLRRALEVAGGHDKP